MFTFIEESKPNIDATGCWSIILQEITHYTMETYGGVEVLFLQS
jgi:hypothetical protein